MSQIQDRTKNRTNWKRINRKIAPGFTYRDLKQILESVQATEVSAFKINLGFGCMLYNVIEKVFRYYYVSNNHFLFDKAFTISNHTDINNFFEKIVSLDLGETYYLRRPTSGWVLAGLPNIQIRVMRMNDIPIGTGIALPAHIKRSRSIISLTHHVKQGRAYNDNLCFFRCLALHFGSNLGGLEETAKSYKKRLEEATGRKYDEGIRLDTLEEVEKEFNLAIHVYSLGENKIAKVVRLSQNYDANNTLRLNLYENHFSYISKFKSYAKKYQCPACSQFLGKACNLTRHIRKCQTEIKHIYLGGKFSNRKTLFEQLKDINIEVPKDDQFDSYFSFFDFEAIQTVDDDDDMVELGRTLHFTHVPATVSICSSVPGHTEPHHIQSNGDPQKLVDDFVMKLLEVQKTREYLLTQKYKPFLEELRKREDDLYSMLGIETSSESKETPYTKTYEEENLDHNSDDDSEDDSESSGNDDDSDTEDVCCTSSRSRMKRKSKQKSKKGKRRKRSSNEDCFVIREADDKDNTDYDSDESNRNSEEESDMEGFINNNSDDDEENDANFYREFNNRNRVEESEPVLETSSPSEPSREQRELSPLKRKVTEHRLKNTRNCLKRLLRYIEQHTVLGFNSQGYDLPLIRPYLPSSLIKSKNSPRQVIKRGNTYMSIASPKLKFLDIGNYLAAGTKLTDFYKSFNVSTPKGVFPYQWFDSLDKLHEEELPRRSRAMREALENVKNDPENEELQQIVEELSKDDPYYSILTDKTIPNEEVDYAQQMWDQLDIYTFAGYVKYYNDADVTGCVEAVTKMLENKKEKGLDMFKISVSLPGLTQRYLFTNLGDDYFVGFGEEHKHIEKELRESITGGPSIIFHRYHERLKTHIKGIKENICKCVLGFDANALYLYCLGQKMPTGWYTIQNEADRFKKHQKYSKESIQWLHYVMKTKNIKIKHAENGGEHRIENFLVDGYDEENNTVYEYHGCYWHGHFCTSSYDEEKWQKTLERDQEIRDAGYTLETITSCEWKKIPESENFYPPLREENDPSETENDGTETITKECILDDVQNERVFGFIKVDIRVPEHLISTFSEFPPIFKNTEIKLNDIGDHMKSFCEQNGRKTGVKRSLISSMHGKEIVLLTPLLKWYLDNGLVVDRVHYILSYNGKSCFDWFVREVTHDRRAADLGGVERKMAGEAMKLMGNCGYGYTVMNRSNHTRTSFAKLKNLNKHTKNPLLKIYEELNEDIFEVQKQKRTIMHDLPLHVGIAVYSYAKLRMLQFWKFIHEYLDNDLYQFMEMDTDSLYIAFAKDTIDECVKPHLKEAWEQEKYKWFSSDDAKCKFKFEDEIITFKQYDKRTPGKFKMEYEGEGMFCLNSKTYYIWGEKDEAGNSHPKCSCKGVQQKRTIITKEDFQEVLTTQLPRKVENAGFIRGKDGTIKTYSQTKVGMSYVYMKRKVLDDGMSTTHLDI